MKRILFVLVCLSLIALPSLAAKADRASDRPQLEAISQGLASPPAWNTATTRGTVTTVYLSGEFGEGPFGAFEMRLVDGVTYVRHECGNEAQRLGCAALASGDTVQVRSTLGGQLAPFCGPWDGIIDTSTVVLLYRWNGSTWVLLTTP